MRKQDELKRDYARNIAASMGRSPLRGASTATATAEPGAGAGPQLSVQRRNDVITVPIDLVDPDPDQPREEFGDEELEQLGASLVERGQLQTVVVYKLGDRYRLVCGERRWRAAQKKGMPTINATLLRDRPGEVDLLILQHQENHHRKGLTRKEEGKLYLRLMERFGLSKAEIARKLSITEGDVSRGLAIEEKLPDDVKEKVVDGKIAPTVAYEITKVQDPGRQRALADLAERGATRAEVIDAVKQARAAEGKKVAPRKRPAEDRARGRERWEFRLEDGSKVTITGPAAGSWSESRSALRAALDAIEGQGGAD